MITVESPPGFVVHTNIQKAAFDNGFRLDRGIDAGWVHYGSTTSQGDVWLAATSSQGPWYLSLNHSGVAAELKNYLTAVEGGPGISTFSFKTESDIYAAIGRVYQLGISLPDVPLQRFQTETADLPRTTEEQRLTVQRKGQNIFRQALMGYWNSTCPLTGITDPALLRASHIVAWSDCETDALRLDVHNGILLSALWDAAFDSGLVSFDDAGNILTSPRLGEAAKAELKITDAVKIPNLTAAHKVNLAVHRAKYGFHA